MTENNKTIGIVISVALIALLGAVFIQILADNTVDKTQLATKTDTINIASARLAANAINETYYFHLTEGCPWSTWRKDQGTACYVSNKDIKNSSGGTLTDPSDVVFVQNGAVCTGANSGDLSFVNSELMNSTPTNTTTVTYTYCPSNYITQSWQRTVFNLVPGFFALAILLGVAYAIFYIMKREGVNIE